MINIGLMLSLIGAGLLLAGPVGARTGLWSFTVGFLLPALSLPLALIGASLSLAGGIKSGQWEMAALGIVAGLAAAGVPIAVILSARGKPPIHDITTDADNPPAFVEILELRAGAANPPDYAGEDVAAQQRRAYPDIQPVVVGATGSEAFDGALAAVRDLGWDVVASERASGRIEAVDTTFWFGFKDDVIVRLTQTPGGTRVDVRSKSRVGVGDVGANARRVRGLLERLRAQIGRAHV